MTVWVIGDPHPDDLFPDGESVRRLPYLSTTRDVHGVEEHHRGDPVEVTGVGFDPGSSYEAVDGVSQRIVTQPTLYVAFAQPSHPLDQWRCRGVLYEVDGDTAGQWRSPWTGWEAGQVVKLRRVRG